MKILADAHIPYLKGVAEQFGEVQYLPGNKFDKAAIADKDVLIVRTVTRFDEAILSGSSVKLICSATIGYDHIDTDYCDANDIGWRTAPGCNANSVEQYVTASLLHLAHKYGFDLQSQTIGVVGVGNVGRKVAAACRKMGMRVLLNDPPRAEQEGNMEQFVSLETIQQEANIITFHPPLTRDGAHATYHLADEQFFDNLAHQPFIINSSRGAVVSNRALTAAIKQEQVAGAVIDCWENEPDVDRELLQLVDLGTPHIAGYSADGKWTGTKMSLENINDYFELNRERIELNDIDAPANAQVIDLAHIPEEEQLQHAVWHTYQPLRDSNLLKVSPEQFYLFRSHYPLRREYHAYQVVNAAQEVEPTLRQLGFDIK